MSSINSVVDRALNAYCTPARIFLILGVMSLFLVIVLNLRVTGSCVVSGGGAAGGSSDGQTKCVFAAAMWVVLVVQALFVLGWTWLIQYLCPTSTTAAWVLLVIPFLTSVFRVM